jgi:hypothetical protein
MERKRDRGRFVVEDSYDEPEQEEVEQQEIEQGEAEPLERMTGHGPQACKRFARKQFAIALPFIVSMLLEKAESGSVSHLRLFMKLAGLEEKIVPLKRTPKRKSLEVILMEQWEKDKEEWLARDEKPGPVCPVPSEFDF